MAGKQGTLNKFFGKPNGTKPAAPQQAKLAFSNKASVKRDDTKENEPTSSSEDVKGEGMTHEKALHETISKNDAIDSAEDVTTHEASAKHEVSTPVKTESPTQTRKRSAEEDDNDAVSAAEDSEPPAKKTKTGVSSTKQASGKASKKQDKTAAPKASLKVKEEEQEEESTPAARAKSRGQSRRKVVEEDDEDEEIAAPVPKKTPIRDVKDPESSPAEAEKDVSDEESEVESEDEKPEVVAKTREKIQATLKANTKDPYPDWKAGDPVPYAALCTTFSKIEMTTKRLEIAAHCSLFLRQVMRLTPDDLLPTVLLMVNKLAADYAGIELGIGESLIMKAIGESTGRTVATVKADQKEIGDLGLVAVKSRAKQGTMFKPKALTVRSVHKSLLEIAVMSGSGAQGQKVSGIKKLLSSADVAGVGKGKVDITENKGGPSESKFIVRTLEGKLRLGLADKSVLVSLAQAIVFHEASQKGKVPSSEQLAKGESTLKSVYSELPSYEVIIPAILEHGLDGLRENCKLQPGVPLKPMLAKPTKSISEVLDRFDQKEFTCEYKYDGERAQIHFVSHDSASQYATAAPNAGKSERGVANVFSRNSEDLSKKYPDILDALPRWVKEGTTSFVLDCEAVAWDLKEKKVLPFQQLMTRKRKDVKLEDISVKVCVFAFDMLFFNDEALVNKSFRERREKLHSAFHEVEGEFAFAKYGDGNEVDAIQLLLDDSVKSGCEGLMVKMLDGAESSYEPSKRSQNWLKVKKDYLAGAGDSLDLVVLGAYHGRGKRTSWYGAFLLACYNSNKQTYETVCNIGTGFSDEVLASLYEKLSEIVIERPKPFYSHSSGNKDQPDVWFEPKYVWEVKTADLTISPRYKAAADVVGADGKGVSLRFPRFIKEREDKNPDMATTHRQVAEMYKAQDTVKEKKTGIDDDFEY